MRSSLTTAVGLFNFVLSAGASVLPRQASQSPTVQVTNGTVEGLYSSSYSQDHFLGIPFAQPPTGSRRFDHPHSINESWTSTLSATAYGPICPNYLLNIGIDPLDITYEQSENCLTLNVVRPAGIDSNAKLPVMFWIYGGAFQEGGGTDGRYNMSYMVQNSIDMGMPTIMVNFNYRLGGWGFLAGDDVKSAGKMNGGLLDQRMALQWVHENIAAFGGDPGNVTIFGESAGAASVGFHLLAYGGRDDGLFQAAIAESGGPFYYGSFPSDESSQTQYAAVLAGTNCTTSTDTLECLRSSSFTDLDAVFATQWWVPSVDGDFIPQYNSLSLASGKFINVPLLIGTNTDEGKLFTGYGVNSTEEFAEAVLTNIFNRPQSDSTLDLILEAYPFPGAASAAGASDDSIIPSAPYGEQYMRMARYLGDSLFIAGRRYTCQVWNDNDLPVYSYRFNTIPAGVDPIIWGAAHYLEVGFVFDNVPGTGMDTSSFAIEDADRRQKYLALGQLMSLSNFTIEWPLYSADAPSNIVFDGNTTSYIESDNWRTDALNIFIDNALDFSR
ncbi:hypothetical protein BP5796_12111 [Coleophoma crateriformis]|uniref:Carboxylic ester hydrolase n=1 Tax=Coleophoma crateriformis TaxID=565419 RepID=A0A3D8QBV3_9HELO|nr:hypothetical protein BP5796_12111 [Coleophoma crateriformis]